MLLFIPKRVKYTVKTVSFLQHSSAPACEPKEGKNGWLKEIEHWVSTVKMPS